MSKDNQGGTTFQLKMVKNVSWLVLFRTISQAGSWIATIYIARILLPEDYGLIGMATIITGYAEIFAEMGLGDAIIQRKETTQKELSSLFIFTVVLGLFLALLCVPIAYLTAFLMKEPRLVPLTSSVAFIFLFSSIRIVPFNVLRKEIRFKQLGQIETIATLVSVCAMVAMAKSGLGVWTLVLGRIIRQVIYGLLVFVYCKWRPSLHFSFKEIREYLSFGSVVMFGSSVFYIYGNIAVFFAGRVWPVASVGLYNFGKELADIPASRILPLVREVAYPVLSRLKDDNIVEFRNFFVRVTKIMSFVFFPVYIAGALLSHELTVVLLDKKWEDISGIFAYFCVFQVMVVLTKLNSDGLRALGKPKYELYFYTMLTSVLGVGYWLTAPKGIVTFLTMRFIVTVIALMLWQSFTMKKLGISLGALFTSVRTPLFSTVVMGTIIMGVKSVARMYDCPMVLILIAGSIAGGCAYLMSCYFLEKDFYSVVFDYFKKKEKVQKSAI